MTVTVTGKPSSFSQPGAEPATTPACLNRTGRGLPTDAVGNTMPAGAGVGGGMSDGSVVELWRYPVKSMRGEQLSTSYFTPKGVLGDRALALMDVQTGHVVSAKNPRKWPGMLDVQAEFVVAPEPGAPLSPVRVTLTDGRSTSTDDAAFEDLMSTTFGRPVTLATVAPPAPSLEEYWPDIEELDHQETVTDEDMPPGTFFDLAYVHVLTTATMEQLRRLHPDGAIDVRRFRPNVVVQPDGEDAGFVESGWLGRELHIGSDVVLGITDHCPRCVMTTLAQNGLPKDSAILRTAARENGVHVGVYANVVRGGAVHQGDVVSLL